MMGSKILAGLLAGLPLSGVFVFYFIVRGRAFVALLKSTDPDMAKMTDNQLFFLFLGAFALGAFVGISLCRNAAKVPDIGDWGGCGDDGPNRLAAGENRRPKSGRC
jgi:hypothetical protein